MARKAAAERSSEAKPEPVGQARGIGTVSPEVAEELLKEACAPARSDAHEEANAGANTGKACGQAVVGAQGAKDEEALATPMAKEVGDQGIAREDCDRAEAAFAQGLGRAVDDLGARRARSVPRGRTELDGCVHRPRPRWGCSTRTAIGKERM